ncbi:MAG: hypothetical protein BM564_06940 [Bacteroidetes bacterium MedPE-SWsnd-G2]|nr:MAG: hypothetical protein BM564_06940 [Bacteroidetes bacterium MedPE-SWsnd-G2]
MKNINEAKTTGQGSEGTKKTQKHEVNLQKNGTLYFQVGLILCLLATYGLFEMRFETEVTSVGELAMSRDSSEEFNVKNYVAETPKEEAQPEKKVKKVVLKGTPKVIDNEDNSKPETAVITPDQNNTSEIAKIEDIIVDEGPDETPEIFNMMGVEQVPVYPGCERAKSRDSKMKCMSDKLAKLIRKNFNGNLAEELGLEGRQRISVQFKIDKNGMVTDVMARAPHPRLEKEASRVMRKIPELTPGKQRDNPVEVMYRMPIVFQVQ